MLFDDEFIASLQNDPVNGALRICDAAINKELYSEDDHYGTTWFDVALDMLLETYSLLAEILVSKIPSININSPNIEGSYDETCENLFEYITEVRKILVPESAKLKVQAYRSKFRTSLGNGFSYEFSQGDLERIQVLLNELRDLIAKAHQLDKEHKQRLISRLEKMQSEIHKKLSDLDRFWGLVGEAGVAFGKLAEDSKPIVDRIREITHIIWRTQARAEELPSGVGFPSLEQKSLDSEDT
jgi:hypothetical protein